MQRTRAEQIADASPRPRERLGRGLRLAGLGLLIAAAATVIALYTRQVRLQPECAARYRHARTATDTAVVDAMRVGRKDPSFQTCGSQRAALERGLIH